MKQIETKKRDASRFFCIYKHHVIANEVRVWRSLAACSEIVMFRDAVVGSYLLEDAMHRVSTKKCK
jgi:hypothetical protein